MIDTQILAEINNLRIRMDERDGKIERQAEVITKLEQSRKDMKADREALLRVARAAYAYDYCNDDSLERKKRLLLEMRNALRDAKHLLG